MLDLLLGWFVLLALLFVVAIRRSPTRGGALTIAYFMSLSLLHVPGIMPFVASDSFLTKLDETRLGFEMTLLGMAAFVGGAIFACKMKSVWSTELQIRTSDASTYERLGKRMLVLGLAAYFLLLPLSGIIPSLTSIVSGLGTLVILGLWVILYGAWQEASGGLLLAVFVTLPALPLATLVSGGFLGFGINWVLSVLAFLFVLTKRRIWFYAIAPFAVYLGFSLFVTYMGQRIGIREVVWEQEAGLLDRLDRVSSIVTEFQFFDLNSPTHVAALEDRLNQNWLVGTAIIRHESGWTDYAYGMTVPLWALIPRALWPDKPTVGGSGDVVTNYTGVRFGRNTSVGIGQVLEFYINFGPLGVISGFFVLGYVLMRLDRGIIRSLATYDLRGLVLRAMPGLALLQPGGSLLEIFVGCAAAYVGGYLILSMPIFGIALASRPDGQLA